MSDLQIALIVLGIVIIAAVIIYNWQQEKKLRNRIGEDFIVPQKDVLIEESYADTVTVKQKVEENFPKTDAVRQSNPSTLNSSKTDEIAPINELSETIAPSEIIEEQEIAVVKAVHNTAEVEEEIVKKDTLSTPIEAPSVALPKDIDTQVDLIALLTATKPMNGKSLFIMKQEILKDIGVMTMLYGADQTSQWHAIDETTSENDIFKKVICSLQLADRRGPVPKAIINKFQFAMEAIGVEFEAYVDWQGEGDPAQRAIDLDDFCMNVDQLVSVHLIQGKTPIHGTKFKGLAEANDMQLENGKFYCFDEKNKGQVLFTLINADNQPFTAENLRLNIVRGATFQIEVPKLANCEHTFNRMVLVAQQMAASIGAQMVDDNQRPLGTTQIEKIRQQLKLIHTTMVDREIAPGSTLSQRLFS